MEVNATILSATLRRLDAGACPKRCRCHDGDMANPSALTGPSLTAGYTPSVVGGAPPWTQHRGRFTFRFVDGMLKDGQCRFADGMLRAPVHTVQRQIDAWDSKVGDWVARQFDAIWERHLSKVLGCLAYGSSGGEATWKVGESGTVDIECLHDIHLFDRTPVEVAGKQVGINVRNCRSGEKQAAAPVRLRGHRWWWVINEPEYGSYWGRSRLEGSWEDWIEKCGFKGARDIRRTWFFKNAYRGGMIRHPMGVIDLGGGVVRSCQDYARELLEKFETGGVLALPNVMDDRGNYLWVFEPPAIQGEFKSEYLKDLDAGILIGAGIPDEVIKGGETGSGYSGRAVPALLYWTSEDLVADNSLRTIDEQLVRPGARINFGDRVEYTVKNLSLVPKPEEGQPGQQGGQPAGGALGQVAERARQIAMSLPEGFTGKATDAAGRVYHYVGGKRVGKDGKSTKAATPAKVGGASTRPHTGKGHYGREQEFRRRLEREATDKIKKQYRSLPEKAKEVVKAAYKSAATAIESQVRDWPRHLINYTTAPVADTVLTKWLAEGGVLHGTLLGGREKMAMSLGAMGVAYAVVQIRKKLRKKETAMSLPEAPTPAEMAAAARRMLEELAKLAGEGKKLPIPSVEELQEQIEADMAADRVGGTAMSLESTSPIVDAIIDRGVAAGVGVSDEIRRKVRALVKKKFSRKSY